MSGSLLDKRWPWIVAATALLLLLASTFVEIEIGGAGGYERPRGSIEQIAELRERDDLRVLFILVDTLRSGHLSSYGYARETSPTLDRLAASGVRFARNFAQSSWTKASMASLWTGMHPVRTGVTRFDHVLPDDALTAVEVLRDSGFHTVGVWRNGWVAPTFGFEQGFEVYSRPAPKPLPPSVRLENPTLRTRGTDEDVVTGALEFLRLRGHERWFLYLHLMDVHEYLYDEETALFGSTYTDAYDNSVRWTDSVIEVLLAHLAHRGLADDTLVVVTSDHGEAFLERGWEGHAREVYRESTEVPWIIAFPFELDPGAVIEARSSNLDIWPTLLDLLGLPPLPEADGRSRVPEILASLRGEEPADDGPPTITFLDQTWGRPGNEPRPAVSVVEGGRRYVRQTTGRELGEELFDYERDPRELVNRSGAEPEEVERMRQIADRYLEHSPPWGETPTREIDELELNHLRALGYAIP